MNVHVLPAAFRPARRLASIGVSEILKITFAAAARKRTGQPVIILGAGEPDFDTLDHVKEAAVQAKFARENGLEFELDQITCGAGAKQVLYNAFMATLEPGDEVVIPAPFWTSYADIVLICGGKRTRCPQIVVRGC